MTKQIIYEPAIGELMPDGAQQYSLPVAGWVVHALVPDDFTTAGTVFHDKTANIELAEPFKHYFQGQENL